jgi:NAD(P)H-dependent FMN reductase
MPNLMIIIASTRPGRIGLPVGRWFEQRARDHGGLEVTVADLAEWGLPFLDEPNHPRLQRYTRQHTIRWSAAVEAADAFVFVMPEYNHGIKPRSRTPSTTCTTSGSESRSASSPTVAWPPAPGRCR